MLRQVSGPRVFLCALAFRMADQPQEDESQDNAGTGAEISTDNDVPTTFTINQLSALGSVLIPADVYFRVCGGEWKLSRLNGECICLRMSRRKRIE